MEGHHFIPCTVDNSKKYESTTKLDREENIVCLCPICHRAIHYGDEATKKQRLEQLLSIQKEQLSTMGIDLSLEELFALYQV